MSVGTHRVFRFRLNHPGEGEPLPEEGDFMVSVTKKPAEQWSTYRVLRVKLSRDVTEPWCNGGHPEGDGIPEGMVVRVLHFRIGVVRVEPSERPADAMTWRMLSDKPHHRH